jgi:hypothetical protein
MSPATTYPVAGTVVTEQGHCDTPARTSFWEKRFFAQLQTGNTGLKSVPGTIQ